MKIAVTAAALISAAAIAGCGGSSGPSVADQCRTHSAQVAHELLPPASNPPADIVRYAISTGYKLCVEGGGPHEH